MSRDVQNEGGESSGGGDRHSTDHFFQMEFFWRRDLLHPQYSSNLLLIAVLVRELTMLILEIIAVLVR